jgi:glutathione S-transferase
MYKLIIGNRTYSSWSLRGWLACKASGLPFETEVLPMDTPEWVAGTSKGELPAGKVPTLWHTDPAGQSMVIWDSLAIIDWLADKVRQARISRGHYWPQDWAARALARSICAEMHTGFVALRQGCPMNLQQNFPNFAPTPEILADVARIDTLWTEALTKFHSIDEAHEGPFLFGTFSAADMMYAPVVTRIATYNLPVGEVSKAYVAEMLAHPWMQEWIADAKAETYPFTRYPIPGGVPA